MKQEDFNIKSLGLPRFISPLNLSNVEGDGLIDYTDSRDRILHNHDLEYVTSCFEKGEVPLSFEKSGPCENLFFNPAATRAAIVTCGGLCPGINDVIRGIVFQLEGRYGVKKIFGIRYGFAGLTPDFDYPMVELNMDKVDEIQHNGGSILGSSRGAQDMSQVVDTLERENINILFCIGGDGTLKGAHAIVEEIAKRNLKISVAGIPKTIDNDINFTDRSFGFETAFSIATNIIQVSHNEAKGYHNGIALIKLMGRDSGFIAAHAAMAQQDVNFVIVPEMDFDLHGDKGLFTALRHRLEERHHAVIVVAEGAGQFLFENAYAGEDASGNLLHKDIGIFLRDAIIEEFHKQDFPISLKYIDPSYIIRSAAANPNDSLFCIRLAQDAVHAAMAGKTDFVVGNWDAEFILLPIPMATKERKKIDLESDFWGSVLGTTRQPSSLKNH